MPAPPKCRPEGRLGRVTARPCRCIAVATLRREVSCPAREEHRDEQARRQCGPLNARTTTAENQVSSDSTGHAPTKTSSGMWKQGECGARPTAIPAASSTRMIYAAGGRIVPVTRVVSSGHGDLGREPVTRERRVRNRSPSSSRRKAKSRCLRRDTLSENAGAIIPH